MTLMTSSILTKSFTNQVKRSSSSSISFSNFGGFLQQTFNSISNNFVNARPTMESSFQNVYLIFSNIRRRIEDLRYSFTKYIPTEDGLRITLNKKYCRLYSLQYDIGTTFHKYFTKVFQ